MDQIETVLTRGVDGVYPSKDVLEKILRSDKKLTLYQGFDPTGIQMHIGHMVGLRKLAQFQKLGHKVIFLIGDGTGQAGDPSGKTRSRENYLTNEELRKNAKDYVLQAGKIVDFEGDNPVEIRYNGDWLNKLTLADLLGIAEHFTLQQMLERDLYQERLKENQPVNLREFFYPLLQGYDSVAMKVDLEIGGKDQLFNMLAGRQLVEQELHKEKFVLTTPLLADSSGRKIGKTEGNVIAIDGKPEELFGQIMSLGDDVIVKGLEYLTDVDMEEVKRIEKELEDGANPIEFKKKLAFEIVKDLNNEGAAKQGQEYFEKTVQNKEMPTNIHTVIVGDMKDMEILEVLTNLTQATTSRSEARRMVEQGGVEIDGKKVTDPTVIVKLENGMILKVGKRNYIKLEK